MNASQHGEDGILLDFCARLGERVRLSHWVVDVGAWDGVHLSNTYELVAHHGYRGVLIEADRRKWQALTQNAKRLNSIAVNAEVSAEGPSSLDRILGGTPIPADFDVLSIDVDGVDYWIWQGLGAFSPKLVVIEYNPTVPNQINFVQPKTQSANWGSSALALKELGEIKGYALVAATLTNLIFLRNDMAKVISHQGHSLQDVRPWGEDSVAVFSGYDGTLFLSRALELPWLDCRIDPMGIQILPRTLRVFPPNARPLTRLLQRAWRRLRS